MNRIAIIFFRYLFSAVSLPAGLLLLCACFSDIDELAERARQGNPQAQYELGLCYQHGTDVPADRFKAAEWFRRAAKQNHAEAQYRLGCNADQRGDSENAVKWYRKAAELGHAYAQNNLGVLYATGKGVKKDSTAALYWYEKAAEQNDPYAMTNIGDYYLSGQDCLKKDAEKARAWYRRAAELGYSEAQNTLGNQLRNINRMEEALQWYRKAAWQNNPYAMTNIAEFHEYGLGGLPRNQQKAMEWYRKAAEQGYGKAQYILADKLWAENKQEQAIAWFRKAAEQKYAPALNDLGWCYETGSGLKQDRTEAVIFYHEAALSGYPRAQVNLGKCYYYGNGIERDYKKALEWFRKAAEQNHAEAICYLGDCYFYGHGIGKDSRKAVDLFTRAAEMKIPEAQQMLGYCFENGIGTEKNQKEAVKWYRRAAAQDYAPGITASGWCYLNGLGIEKDEKKAIELFRQAMEQEESCAINNLGHCYMQGQGVAKDYEKAVSLFRKAVAIDRNPLALLNLGVCHDNGFGLPRDRKKAMEYFRQSVKQGCVDAMCHLASHYLREKDWKQAEAWFLKAAATGKPETFNLIGSFYTFNREVFDQEKAFYWLSKGAELNHPAAQANLAYLHETGSGDIRNLKKAFYWYQKSLTQEWTITSCYFTGLYCLHGCGTKKNTKRGLELLNEILEKKADDPPSLYTIAMYHWRKKEYAEAYPLFMRAAKNGGMAAQYMTALSHMKGQGTGQDDFLAGCWMRLSAENGYENARRPLSALQKKLSPEQWKQTEEFVRNHKKARITLYQDDYGELRMRKALRKTDKLHQSRNESSK